MIHLSSLIVRNAESLYSQDLCILSRYRKLTHVNPFPSLLDSQENILQPLEQGLYSLFSETDNNQHMIFQNIRLIWVKPWNSYFLKSPGEFKEKNACCFGSATISPILQGSDWVWETINNWFYTTYLVKLIANISKAFRYLIKTLWKWVLEHSLDMS